MKFFDYRYRVVYGDTDKMGVSYYGNCFKWFEGARNEYFRALGFPYTECEKRGYFLPAVECGAKYFSPSTYDDLIVVRVSVSGITRTTIRFEYQIFAEDLKRLIVTGFSTHVFVDKDFKPARVLDEVKKVVTLHALLEK